MKKGEYRPAVQPLPPADEQVAAILDLGSRRMEEQRLSRDERAKLIEMRRKEEERKRREQEKAAATKEIRALIYLPSNLRKRIAEIAGDESVSMSQVITFLLFEAVDEYERGKISFDEYKERSNSPRYEWVLLHPEDNDRRQSRKTENLRKKQKIRDIP